MPDHRHRQLRHPRRLLVCGVLLAVLLVTHATGTRAFSLAPSALGQPAALAALAGIVAGHDHASAAGAIAPLSSGAAIDPTLGPPSNLVLTPLDSTIRGNWTP